jgi:hypothetical protein
MYNKESKSDMHMRLRGSIRARANNQKGMVSFLVVMIMMMVIMLIVMGFVQITNQNRREALDRQLSNQAFYAAESGINSVISTIRQKQKDGLAIPTQTNCSGEYGEVILADGVKTTCLLVDPKVNNIVVTEINTSVPKVIPVQAVAASGTPTALKSLTFEWTADQDGPLSCTAVGTYPPSADNCPPILRLDITRGTGSNADGLNAQTSSLFLQRADSAAPSLTVNLDGKTTRTGADCTPSGGKTTCSRTINFGLGASNLSTAYIRALTIYKDASSLKITGTLVDDTTAYFIGQVKIDATGKAQDVLRRVQVRVNPESTAKLTMPTSAIFSDNSVCKRFIVGYDGTYANMANECEDVPSEDVPDASLGGGCGSGCGPTGPGPAVGDRIFYSRRYTNTSNNASSSVTGCTWSWGDTTSDTNKWCYYHDVTDPHIFPKVYPGTTVKCYIVTIKITITTSGGVKSGLMDQKIPYGLDASAYCGGVWKRMP